MVYQHKGKRFNCTCKFKDKCWAYSSDGCTIDPSEYKMCYEYMRFELE